MSSFSIELSGQNYVGELYQTLDLPWALGLHWEGEYYGNWGLMADAQFSQGQTRKADPEGRFPQGLTLWQSSMNVGFRYLDPSFLPMGISGGFLFLHGESEEMQDVELLLSSGESDFGFFAEIHSDWSTLGFGRMQIFTRFCTVMTLPTHSRFLRTGLRFAL